MILKQRGIQDVEVEKYITNVDGMAAGKLFVLVGWWKAKLKKVF